MANWVISISVKPIGIGMIFIVANCTLGLSIQSVSTGMILVSTRLKCPVC